MRKPLKLSRFDIIKNFVIQNIEQHHKDIGHLLTAEFKISRQAANSYLLKLSGKNVIFAEGRTRGKKYYLKPVIQKEFLLNVCQTPEEDVVWRKKLEPLVKDIQSNVVNICAYGFTEMFNNVITHADARTAGIKFALFPNKISMSIIDDGVGIFNKITQERNLEDHRHAILELSKGKLTTAKEGHTGEGIFFTSRMFDEFSILSSKLYFSHRGEDDWLIEEEEKDFKGTCVSMSIDTNSNRTAKEVYDRYSSDDENDFSKTYVPVKLLIHGRENLISRSQAKRLLARFEGFKEILLDFTEIEFIGQAFADEIFRVYKIANPRRRIVYINANQSVVKMIRRAVGQVDPNQIGINFDGSG
ncbi:MAG: DUF4325 domain-containing protein [Elusimicrobia bacterium]|nr:DUF4325 domain-containing protein [Elusimicrobiota bacterium]